MGAKRTAERLILRKTLRWPSRMRRLLAGRPPRNGRGVALDRDLHWALFLQDLVRIDIAATSPSEARVNLSAAVDLVEDPPRPLARVEALRIAGCPARLYADGTSPEPPLLIYLHGGGWVAGDLDSHDGLCRRLCADTGWIVVSVDYPRAPERPFPQGLDAIGQVVQELQVRASSLGADPNRLALGGDSAGGNLTVAALLDLRDRGVALPHLQVLLYPGTDLRRNTPSHEEFAAGFILTRHSIELYQSHYGAEALDPRASVLLAENLGGLPPAIVLTAGFDPLRDEGEALVDRFLRAGVPTLHLDARSMVHGFAHMGDVLPAADRELARLTGAMRGELSLTCA